MRTDLQAKFIDHLNRKQCDRGFTLVELLVVIIILGILAAIALPNFLNQSAKAKQTEAKQNVALINRSQTAYRAENITFANTFDILGTGTMSGGTQFNASNYTYDLVANRDSTSIIATTNNTDLKSYSGGTFVYANAESNSAISSLICEANVPGTNVINAPNVVSSAVSCPSNSQSL